MELLLCPIRSYRLPFALMKNNISIQLKAAFLLIVFALNTVVGFACAIGIDMGFNTHHHDDMDMTATVHVHANGSKHAHHEEADHQDQVKHHSGDEKDNCCKDKVTKITQADKAVPQSYSAVHPVFFTAFLSAFYNVNFLSTFSIAKDVKPFVRSHHPPIPNIRIAIQSFQI